RMLTTTIVADPILSTAIAELARPAHTPFDLDALLRHADAASRSLDAFASALERPSSDLVRPARDAYLIGLVLAFVLARACANAPSLRDRITRFLATARRLLDTVEPLVPPTDRERRRALL